jgi:hypothetical protein
VGVSSCSRAVPPTMGVAMAVRRGEADASGGVQTVARTGGGERARSCWRERLSGLQWLRRWRECGSWKGGWNRSCWGRLGLVTTVCERHGVDIIVAPHGAVEAAEEGCVQIMDGVPTVAGCDCKRSATAEQGSDAGEGRPWAYAIAVREDQRNKF